MRILTMTLSFCIIGLISCRTNSDKKELTDVPNLVGNWILSSSYGAKCNVCPEVIFNDSSTGSLIKPSKRSYSFNYKIQKERISFKFKEGQDFIDMNSEFKYYLKSDTILLYLTLVPLDSEGELILIAEK